MAVWMPHRPLTARYKEPVRVTQYFTKAHLNFTHIVLLTMIHISTQRGQHRGGKGTLHEKS